MFRQATEQDLSQERIATINEMLTTYDGTDVQLRHLQAITVAKRRQLKAEEYLSILNTERELKPSESKPACILCSGTRGRLNEDGAHSLCAAFKAKGLETPNLGDDCIPCRGEGNLCMMTPGYALYNPNQKAMNAVFPKCPECDGTGVKQ